MPLAASSKEVQEHVQERKRIAYRYLCADYTRIVDELERGVRPWVQPWRSSHTKGGITRPLRHNGEPYTGMNVLLFWSEAMARGYAALIWMTFRQSGELGTHARKGETSSTVIYASRFTKREIDAQGSEVDRDIPFLKAYGCSMLSKSRDCPTIIRIM